MKPPNRPNWKDQQRIIYREKRARRRGPPFHISRPFRGDWSGLKFRDTNWQDADFNDCDLRGADFSRCILTDADLGNAKLCDADLTDADLTGARNLLPNQLCGTNLTGAKLPADLAAFPALIQVRELSQNSAKVFLTLLAVIAFTVVGVASGHDDDLFVPRQSAKLPLLQIEVPLLGFHAAMPVILLALYGYLHLYLHRLWEMLAQLPARFPDGRGLDDVSYPWLLNDLCRSRIPELARHRPPLALVQFLGSLFISYALVPIVIWICWANGLWAQRSDLSFFQTIILSLAAGTGVWFLWLYRQTFLAKRRANGELSARAQWRGFGYGLIASVTSFVLIHCWTQGIFTAPGLDDNASGRTFRHRVAFKLLKIFHISAQTRIWNRDISTRRPGFSGDPAKAEHEIATVQGANLTGRHFRRAWVRFSFFANAILEESNLNDAVFSGCDFRGAHFRRGSAVAAHFDDSIFSYLEPPAAMARRTKSAQAADFLFFDFKEATFYNAVLNAVDVSYCAFIDCEFGWVEGDYASWLDCSFDRASFKYARLRGVTIGHGMPIPGETPGPISMRECMFSNADLRWAIFDWVDLTGATFDGATLYGASFDRCIGLNAATIIQASNIRDISIPTKLKDQAIRQCRLLDAISLCGGSTTLFRWLVPEYHLLYRIENDPVPTE